MVCASELGWCGQVSPLPKWGASSMILRIGARWRDTFMDPFALAGSTQTIALDPLGVIPIHPSRLMTAQSAGT